MQSLLADADRRIRPDQIERENGRNLLGGDGMDIAHAVQLGVAARELKRAFVHIQRPDIGLGRFETQRQRDRTPTAAQIKERALLRRFRRLAKQHRRAQIHTIAGKHAVRHFHIRLIATQRDMQLPAHVLRLRFRREILLGLCHALSLQTFVLRHPRGNRVHVAKTVMPMSLDNDNNKDTIV